MERSLRDIVRQKLTEEALVVANQIIATQEEQIEAQSEQITSQSDQIAVLTKIVALLTTKIEELQAKNAKLKATSKNSNKPLSSDGYRKLTVKNHMRIAVLHGQDLCVGCYLR